MAENSCRNEKGQWIKKIRWEPEIKILYYRCPFCHTHTQLMEVIMVPYHPNQLDELKARKPATYDFNTLCGEILRCPCGIRLRWEDLEVIAGISLEKEDEEE